MGKKQTDLRYGTQQPDDQEKQSLKVVLGIRKEALCLQAKYVCFGCASNLH